VSVWRNFGPVLKLAAAAVTVGVSLTTGLKLGSLLPGSVSGIAEGFSTAQQFVTTYCEGLESLIDDNTGPWKSVDASRGLDPIAARSAELGPLARDAYFQFLRFLEEKHFDSRKLLENAKKVPGEDGKVRWEAIPRDDSPPSVSPAAAPTMPSPVPTAATVAGGSMLSASASGRALVSTAPDTLLFEAEVRKKPHARARFGVVSWDTRWIRLNYDYLLRYGIKKYGRFIEKTPPNGNSPLPINGLLNYVIGKIKEKTGGADIEVRFFNEFSAPGAAPYAVETFRLESKAKRAEFAATLDMLKAEHARGGGGSAVRGSVEEATAIPAEPRQRQKEEEERRATATAAAPAAPAAEKQHREDNEKGATATAAAAVAVVPAAEKQRREERKKGATARVAAEKKRRQEGGGGSRRRISESSRRTSFVSDIVQRKLGDPSLEVSSTACVRCLLIATSSARLADLTLFSGFNHSVAFVISTVVPGRFSRCAEPMRGNGP
jgi:hypothetical protein